ncbi:Gfo/Idh/MocA family protein [Cohnella rhizosphaerae]|uniref:Gfo/Idh/MocA family oxidoreductase n=1 Tax=Cohnella rhizosphaerae TaxID=1457232 RepID=A0A9X4QW69_9BACL|nr:Gfo/Idh/MocA family oxidoreductase [Cohnella rhizosphaerae]MDG0813520.1 Gfo/Idh/MocA family oxidoreductase [Cohnella rhizosphaerae]
MRPAIIGAGAISALHLQALAGMDEIEAVAIADIDGDRAGEAARQHTIRAYTDYRLMVEKEKPDIVVITLPHHLHRDCAIWCAQSGCHILLEKPMAIRAEDCDEIIGVVNDRKVKLMVGHTQHYFAENIKAREMIESGQLGKLVMINDVRHVDYYADSRPGWFFETAKSGGGIAMNLGSHAIDRIQWLTDSKIAQVKASVSFYGTRGDIEGSLTAFVRTDRGLPCVISQSGYGGVNRDETELVFTEGMLKLRTGAGLWVGRSGEYRQVETIQNEPPFVLQYRDLLDCIRADAVPECSGEYSKSVVSAVQAIYASHRSGQEVALNQQQGGTLACSTAT